MRSAAFSPYCTPRSNGAPEISIRGNGSMIISLPKFLCVSRKRNVLCDDMKQKFVMRKIQAPSRLQRELSADILELIHAEQLAPGTRLAEVALAKRLQVSRTPVRAALKLLTKRKLVRQGARR